MHKFYEWFGGSRHERYFSFAVLMFIFSFVLLPTSKMVNNFFYIFLALPALVFIIFSKRYDFIKKSSVLFFLVFVVWLIIVGSLNGDFQFLRHIVYIFLFIVILMVLVNPSPFHDTRFFRFQFWAVCIYIVGSALVYWANGTYLFGERVVWLPARMTGPIYSSMWISACLALAAPAWLQERRWLEAGAALFLALLSVTLILQSRSGLLGIVLLLMILVAWSLFNNKSRAIVLLLIGAAAGMILFMLRNASGINRIFTEGISPRPEIWARAISEMYDCGLLFGCGLNYDFSLTLPGGYFVNHPHSIYVSFGLYAGLVSLILFLLWIFRVLVISFHEKNPWGLYLLLSVCMLFFDGNLPIDHPNEFWLLVLLPAGLITAYHYKHMPDVS